MAYNKLHKKDFSIAVKTGNANGDQSKFAKEASKGELFFNNYDKKLYMATTTAGGTDAVLYNTNAFSLTPALFVNTYSVLFDGAGDWVDYGASSTLNGATQFTISWWQKTSTNGKVIFSGGSNERVQTLSAGLQVRTGGRTATIGTGAYSNGQWHQLTLTYNAGTYTLYANGSSTPDGTDSNYVTQIGATVFNSFRLGQVANAYYFNGNIDEVAIWSTALSASEIPDIQELGAPIDLTSDNGTYTSSANLTNYWRGGDSDSGTDTTMSDIQGSLNGTLSGDAQFTADAP